MKAAAHLGKLWGTSIIPSVGTNSTKLVLPYLVTYQDLLPNISLCSLILSVRVAQEATVPKITAERTRTFQKEGGGIR